LLDVNDPESVFVKKWPDAVPVGRLFLGHPDEKVQLKNGIPDRASFFIYDLLF